jgi:hypothetical protein
MKELLSLSTQFKETIDNILNSKDIKDTVLITEAIILANLIKAELGEELDARRTLALYTKYQK